MSLPLTSGHIQEGREEGLVLPMKCTGEDEKVICADFVKAALVECLVVYQAAGLVDDDETEDSPRMGRELEWQVRA